MCYFKYVLDFVGLERIGLAILLAFLKSVEVNFGCCYGLNLTSTQMCKIVVCRIYISTYVISVIFSGL